MASNPVVESKLSAGNNRPALWASPHFILFVFFPAMRAVAALVRLHLWLFLCRITTSTLALPLVHSSIPQLAPRSITVTNISGTIRVFDSATDQAILQGPATDGSGTNFSLCAVIWIAFCFIIGTPMAIAGIRGWRFTLGVGIALSAAVCCMCTSIWMEI